MRRGLIVLNGERLRHGLDGELFTEDLEGVIHALKVTYGGGPDFGPTTLPDESFLVMGDNRGVSHDGRSFGLVKQDAILGRAVGVYFSQGNFVWRDL